MPSEDLVIFVFAPIIVIFGVMSFFPEVAVKFKKKKNKTTTERLRPLNHHKWVSHLLVWTVCNLKIYISKTLSFYIPCVLYTYYKHILPSFSSPDIIIIWVLGTPRRVAVCASPRHSTGDCSLAQYPPLAPRPGCRSHFKTKLLVLSLCKFKTYRLYIHFADSIFIRYIVCKYILPFCGLPFTGLIVSSAVELFILI